MIDQQNINLYIFPRVSRIFCCSSNLKHTTFHCKIGFVSIGKQGLFSLYSEISNIYQHNLLSNYRSSAQVHEAAPHFLYRTHLLFSQITASPDNWYIMKMCTSRLPYGSSHLTLGMWAVTCPLTAGLLKAAGAGSVMSHVPQSACKKI